MNPVFILEGLILVKVRPCQVNSPGRKVRGIAMPEENFKPGRYLPGFRMLGKGSYRLVYLPRIC